MATPLIDSISDRMTTWIGSTSSLIIHSLFFLLSFLSHWFFGLDFDSILLVLTTVVSLEAIYLAIFIQRSVNQQGERLEDVEESIDEVEQALDDVEESLDEVEESLKETEDDIDDIAADTAKQLGVPLDKLTVQMQAILDELNELKNKNK